jgi:uncharacterized membrane protein
MYDVVKKRNQKVRIRKLVHSLKYIPIGIIFLAPIILYFMTFNKGLSINSQDWSAFGSFVGGIYAPIAAIISLYVLLKTLKEMEKNNRDNLKHQTKERHLENIRWLTDLLVDMLKNSKNYRRGHANFYNDLKDDLVNALQYDFNPDSSIIKMKAIEIMKNNPSLFQDESVVFNDLFYRVMNTEDTEDGALGCMILIAKLTPEERFWLMQYAKAHNLRAAKDLRFWRSFEDVPQSLNALIKS